MGQVSKPDRDSEQSSKVTEHLVGCIPDRLLTYRYLVLIVRHAKVGVQG